MKRNQIKKKLQSPKKVTKKSTRLNEGDTIRLQNRIKHLRKALT